MSVTVKIPTQLRVATGGQTEVEVEGSNVGEALDAVFAAYGDLRERITQDGTLRRFVNVYVSGEDIRFQQGLETQVNEGDEVTILPAVAGGERASGQGFRLTFSADRLLADASTVVTKKYKTLHPCPDGL